jgi:hypothetical protein
MSNKAKPTATEASVSNAASSSWTIGGPLIVLAATVLLTALYVNLAFLVTDPADYRFLPPFQAHYNRNMNKHLGAEYLSIAKSLAAGQGFSSPFFEPSGPTAWMPPVLPAVQAMFLRVADGDMETVTEIVVLLQVWVLIATAWLILAVARRTTTHITGWVVVLVFLAGLVSQFPLAFQVTHDCWLILLMMDLLLCGLWFSRPLGTGLAASGWGAFGGLCALVSPVLGFVWGILTLGTGWGENTFRRAAIALTVAGLVVLPWTARNYLVFGKWIPIKSNLAFELYQSQCLEPDGVLKLDRVWNHPCASAGPERQEYKRLGEAAYLNHKMDLFRQAVSADPSSFVRRSWNRFLAATILYFPYDPVKEETERYWGLWISRLTHAIPFLSVVLLLGTAPWFGLRREHHIAIAVYFVYLVPYIFVSYYDRYTFPLLGLQILLTVWAAERLCLLTAHFAVPSNSYEPRFSFSSATNQPTAKPMTHRLAIGFVVCGALAWWCGADYVRMVEPRVLRFGNSVVIPDFFQEWYSARLWWDGQPVYAPMQPGVYRYLGVGQDITAGVTEKNAHPPGAVFLALPLGVLDFSDAFAIWNGLSIWAFFGAVWLILSNLRLITPGWAVLPAIAALILSNPFWVQMTHGQLNLILLLLIVGAWTADRRDHAVLAGVLIGIATAIKLFPGYLLVYFLLAGRWRSVLSGLLTIAACSALTSAVLGWNVWSFYLTNILPTTKEFSTVWANASLTGWWLKLFDPALPWSGARLTPLVTSRAIASSGAAVTAIALTAFLWFILQKRFSDSRRDEGFAAAIIIMLLLCPVVWDHYFLLLALPVAVLWKRLHPGFSRLVLGGVLLVLALPPYRLLESGMTLVGASHDEVTGGWLSPPYWTVTILSCQTYALLALLVLLLRHVISFHAKEGKFSTVPSCVGQSPSASATPLPSPAGKAHALWNCGQRGV